MGNYGMTFDMELHDSANCFEEIHVITMPGDYMRMSRWAREGIDGADDGETVANLRRNYATAWHALKREGRLADMGLPEELTVEAIDSMADRFSIYVNEMGDASVPLARQRGR